MNSQIFRKYDIRGKVGIDFQIADIYQITQAIITYFKEHDPQLKTVAVGMDGRVHSPAIKAQVTQALLDHNLGVLFLGVCSSPAFYFATHYLSVTSGIMITASHNPKSYNGLKMVLNRETLWDTQITAIKEIYLNQYTTYTPNTSTEAPTSISITSSKYEHTKHQFVNLNPAHQPLNNYREQDISDLYTDYLAQKFQHLTNSPLKFALDCGNGAACTVVPKLLQKLNWPNVKLLCAELDGNFPNHQADPTQLANLRDLQQVLLADPELNFGAGLDGDADRLGLMTSQGDLVPNDKLLTIFAQSLQYTQPDILNSLTNSNTSDLPKTPISLNNPSALQELTPKKLINLKIIGDIKYSASLKQYLSQQGIETVLAPCGVGFIKASMRQHQAHLGGELSGHFCFSDRYFGFDDGLYALLRFCELLITQNTNLTKLLSQLPTTVYSPEIRMACRPEQKNAIVQHAKTVLAQRTDLTLLDIDGVRSEQGASWGGIRASNTEDVLSLRFEAPTVTELQAVTRDYYEILKPFFDEQTLKTELNL